MFHSKERKEHVESGEPEKDEEHQKGNREQFQT
jgi:hypothetical protein